MTFVTVDKMEVASDGSFILVILGTGQEITISLPEEGEERIKVTTWDTAGDKMDSAYLSCFDE